MLIIVGDTTRNISNMLLLFEISFIEIIAKLRLSAISTMSLITLIIFQNGELSGYVAKFNFVLGFSTREQKTETQ